MNKITFAVHAKNQTNSTSENGHCNGHVDDQNTKEEEVYQDLLHIQRASLLQVFCFFYFHYPFNSYFVYYNFDVSFDWYTHFNRVDSFTIHLLKHQIASYLLEEARERKHARTQSIRCCTFLRSCFLFIAIHCDLFAKFCLFGLFFSISTWILRRPVVPTHIEFRATRFCYTGIDRYGNELFGGITSAQR